MAGRSARGKDRDSEEEEEGEGGTGAEEPGRPGSGTGWKKREKGAAGRDEADRRPSPPPGARLSGRSR